MLPSFARWAAAVVLPQCCGLPGRRQCFSRACLPARWRALPARVASAKGAAGAAGVVVAGACGLGEMGRKIGNSSDYDNHSNTSRRWRSSPTHSPRSPPALPPTAAPRSSPHLLHLLSCHPCPSPHTMHLTYQFAAVHGPSSPFNHERPSAAAVGALGAESIPLPHLYHYHRYHHLPPPQQQPQPLPAARPEWFALPSSSLPKPPVDSPSTAVSNAASPHSLSPPSSPYEPRGASSPYVLPALVVACYVWLRSSLLELTPPCHLCSMLVGDGQLPPRSPPRCAGAGAGCAVRSAALRAWQAIYARTRTHHATARANIQEPLKACRACGMTKTLQWRKGPDGTPSYVFYVSFAPIRRR